MLTVLFLDHTAKLSGGEIALTRLLQALDGQIRPLVVLAEEGPLVERLRSQGVEVVIEPLSSATRNVRKDALAGIGAVAQQAIATLAYAVRLRRLMKERNIDVVHTNSLKSGFYGCLAARLARVPSVWHLRDRVAPDYLPPLAVVLTRAAITLLPNRVVCNSHSTLATIKPRTTPPGWRRALVVPSAVPIADPLDVPAVNKEANRARRSPGLRVGMVGRVAPWKGQHVAIQAFAAASLDPASTLILLGSAMFGEQEYEDRLHSEIRRLNLDGRVEMRGFVEDVLTEVRKMDVLVHASLTPEPFGQVIVEGLASGVPVVATRGGGPSEIITDGVDGLLYEAGDTASLARILKRLEGDVQLRRNLSLRGLQRATDYSPRRIGATVLEVYNDLSRRNGRAPSEV